MLTQISIIDIISIIDKSFLIITRKREKNIMKSKTVKWIPKDGWHHIPGFCVYVQNGLVEKYYGENDPEMNLLTPEKPVKWNTFRTNMLKLRKEGKI